MYVKLDQTQRQTRILHLQPSCVEAEDIRCQFSTISLNDRNVQYEALSYVWGALEHQRTIYISGIEHQVTENLYHAMKDIRLCDRQRTIWIDAICIDQSSTSERSYQVAQMGSIYSQASNVIIWLGKPSRSMEVAFRFFEENGRRPNEHDTESLELKNGGRTDEKTTYALTCLLSPAWFSRIWTVQEWVLAKSSTIHCGRSYIHGDVVEHVAHNLSYDDFELQASFNTFNRPITIVRAIRNKEIGFLSILSEMRSRKASDPRDKIYGLLALLTESEATLLKPDYTLSAEKVFETWAVLWMLNSRKLDILSHIVPHKASILHVPSFVPDWTIELSGDLDDTGLSHYWSLRNRRLHLYSASKGTLNSIRSVRGMLYVRGSFIDTVREIVAHSMYIRKWITKTYELASSSVSDHGCGASGRKSMEAYWLTLCGGLQWNSSRSKDTRRYTIEDMSMVENILRVDCDDSASDNDNDQETFEFSAMYCTIAAGRHFAVTEKRRFSFVPMNAVVGDLIALLAGASVPVVLRKVKDGYTVLGDAHVHGVMDGEAWPDEEELEEIVLV